MWASETDENVTSGTKSASMDSESSTQIHYFGFNFFLMYAAVSHARIPSEVLTVM